MSSGSSGLLGGPTASDGSIQSFYNFLDPGNITGKANSGDIAANFLDPGNLFGMNPAANPQLNGQAANPASAATLTLPAANGSVNPILYSPNSFTARQPAGPGNYNAMAAQLAGPVYLPQVLQPAVPGRVGTNLGAAGSASAMPLSPLQRLGLVGAISPYNPKGNPMVYAR